MNQLRAAMYARVSAEQQAAAHTIESQIAALIGRAQQDSVPVPPERQFVDDGYSGATLVRPALDRLRDLVAAGAIDRVYVHSPDRLARNYAYQVLLLDEWHRYRIEVVFLNRPLGQSPEADLLLQVQGIVAEYERAKIMERSRRGKKHAAQSGSLNVMSGAPYGYRYITVHEGGGQARLEPIAEQAHVVRQIFKWVGQERCSINDVCRRLKESGELTATGRTFWSRTVVWHILHNSAYQGQAAYGKTRMMPRTKKNRSRPARGRPLEPRRSHVAIPVDLNEWICIPVLALVEPALFHAAEQQLQENRSRARLGRRRPGYLLQGLTCCAICGYAYYGKTLHQRGAGGVFRDFSYYRCSGSDGYRFGGEAVCSNKQMNGSLLEAAVWREVCDLIAHPEKLEPQHEGNLGASLPDQDLEALKAQRMKLAHAVERLIDSYTEGLIDKDQFTSRANRTKKSIADLDAKIKADTGTVGQAERMRAAVVRLREMAATLGTRLPELDWNSRRDVNDQLRSRVQPYDLGPHSDSHMKVRVIPIMLANLALLSGATFGAIRPHFLARDVGWPSTDIVIANEKQDPGTFEVVEPLKGRLRAGDLIIVPGMSEWQRPANRTIRDESLRPTEMTATTHRLLLFLGA